MLETRMERRERISSIGAFSCFSSQEYTLAGEVFLVAWSMGSALFHQGDSFFKIMHSMRAWAHIYLPCVTCHLSSPEPHERPCLHASILKYSSKITCYRILCLIGQAVVQARPHFCMQCSALTSMVRQHEMLENYLLQPALPLLFCHVPGIL